MTTQITGLGITTRKPAAASPAPPRTAAPARQTGKKARVVEKYDIALSFAGENRAYIEEVATGLKTAGIKVFYDAFESAELWGKNLVDHLAEIYANRARYVVMLISKEYVEKAWTTHERQQGAGTSARRQRRVHPPRQVRRHPSRLILRTQQQSHHRDLRETHVTPEVRDRYLQLFEGGAYKQ
jgi:hypothetical protein